MKKLIGLMACVMLLGLSSVFAQSKQVTGTVTDKSGFGLPGVSVSIKGTTEGSNTDIDGKWMLSVTSNDVIEFSFMGMVTQEIKVGDKTVINVVLVEDRVMVEEVVITGYGTKKRNEFTGSVTTVNKEVLEQVPMPSVEQVLQGNVAGLNSVAASGQPGAAQQIRIRGVGSINASNQPLYVIDGVPVVSGDMSRNSTTANAMAGLSSNDIENVTVLKDASATSVYGARGANGVIVITTKQGKQGKTTFSFDAEYGFNSLATNGPDRLSTSQWEELMGEGAKNKYGIVVAPGETYETNYDLATKGFGKVYEKGTNTDWDDVILRNQAIQQQYNFSMKGGDSKTNFFTSVGYFGQEGAVKNSDFERFSGLINLNHRATEKITVQTKLNISHSKAHTLAQGGTFSNPMLARYFLLPFDPAYNKDGSPYVPNNAASKLSNGLFNPAYLLENNFQDNKTTKVLGNAQAFYRPIENLKYTVKIGVDYMTFEENEYQSPKHGDGYSVQGRSSAYYTRNYNWVFQNMLDYHLEIDDNNKFDFKLLYEAQKNKLYSMDASAEKVAKTGMYYLTSFADKKAASSNFQTWASASTMINVNYAFMGKVFIDGTYRREGASKFSDDNKYGHFWSTGASYLLSKEDFIKDLGFISELKLRSSYGVNGNSGIGSNLYLALAGFSGSYNGNTVMYNSGIENQDLTWEKNHAFNIGLDYGLFEGRISGTFEYFHRTTSELLLSVPLSRTTGNSKMTANVGEMENQGVEVVLSTDNLTGDFKWYTDFNFTYIKNEITKLDKDIDGNWMPIINGTKRMSVGNNIRTFYMRKWAGVDAANGDALWYVNGKNGATTNDYSKAKRADQGTSTPDFYGGLTNTFKYKGFTLSAQLNFSVGNKVYDSWASYMMSDGKYTASYGGYDTLLDYWKKPGDKTNVPKQIHGGNGKSSSTSTRHLFDADHIRLRNITLSYDLPKSLLANTGISSCNIYARGTNLFTYVFDDDLKFDPETGGNGLLDLALPQMKTISFGVKINF